jgi:hypothetical protein
MKWYRNTNEWAQKTIFGLSIIEVEEVEVYQ